MSNIKFDKKFFLSRAGNFNLNITLLPRITQAQLEVKEKQDFKFNSGGLSEHWSKHNNLNRLSCIDNILLSTNHALNIFHARNLIKNKYVFINKKLITDINYIVKPFSIIAVKAPFKELTLLKIAKNNKFKNPNNIINKGHIVLFKHSVFNLNPQIKNS